MTTPPEPAATLQVVVLHPRDASAATEGDADRLLLMGSPAEGGLSPEPALVSSIVRETDLPVRVLLRLDRSDRIDGGSFTRLVGLAREYAALGADSVSFGFLDVDLEIDRDSCLALASELQLPWSFHAGFDAALEADRAWRDVRSLPWLDGVTTAGSSRGMAAGGADVIARATADVGIARLVVAAGGLVSEDVPWLTRAGVRQFGVGATVRQDRSWTKAYVDVARVRAWRMLLDDALARALGVPVE